MSSPEALPPAASQQLPRRAEEAAAAAGVSPTSAEEESQPFVLNVRGFLEVVGVTGPSLTISSVSPQVRHYGSQSGVSPPTRKTLPATGAAVKGPGVAKPSAATVAGTRTTAAGRGNAVAVKPSSGAAQMPVRAVAATKTAASGAGEEEGKDSGMLGRSQPAVGRGTEEKTTDIRPKVGAARVRTSFEGNKRNEITTTHQQEGTAARVPTGPAPGEKTAVTEEAVEANAGEKAAPAAKPLPKLLKKSLPVVQPKRVLTVAAGGAAESHDQQETTISKPQPKLSKKSLPATLSKRETAAGARPGEVDGEKTAARRPAPKLFKKSPPVTLQKVAPTIEKAGDARDAQEAKDVLVEETEKGNGETAAIKEGKAADREGAASAGNEIQTKKATTIAGSSKSTVEKKAALQASKHAGAGAKTEGQKQRYQDEKQDAEKPRAKAAPVFPAVKGAGKAPATAVPLAENAGDGLRKPAREQAAKEERADEGSRNGAPKDVKPSEATKKEEKDAKAVVTKQIQTGQTVTIKEGTAASKAGAVASEAKQELHKAVKETQSKEGSKADSGAQRETEASAPARKEAQAEAATEGAKTLGATVDLKVAAAEGRAPAVAKHEKKETVTGFKKKGEAKDASLEETKQAGIGARAAQPAVIAAEKKVAKGKDAKRVPPTKPAGTKKSAPAAAAAVAPPGPPGSKKAKAVVFRKAREEEGGNANRGGLLAGNKLKAAKKTEGEPSPASSGSERSKTGKKFARVTAGEREVRIAGKKQKKAAPRKLVKKGEALKPTVIATKRPVPNLRKKASGRIPEAKPSKRPTTEKNLPQHREGTSQQQDEGKRLRPQEKVPEKQEEKVQKQDDGKVQKQQQEVNRQRDGPKKQQKEEEKRQQEKVQKKQEEENFRGQQDTLLRQQKQELRQQQEGLLLQHKQPEESLRQTWESLQEHQRLKQSQATKEKSVNEAGTMLADRPVDAKLQKRHSKEHVQDMEISTGADSATEGASAAVGTKDREKVGAPSPARQQQELLAIPQHSIVSSTIEKSRDEAEVSPSKIKEQIEEDTKRQPEIEQTQQAEIKQPLAYPHSFFPFPSWCTMPPPPPSYNLRSNPWPPQDVLIQRFSPTVQKKMEEHTAMMLQKHNVWVPPRKREKTATAELSASSCANNSKALHYLGLCCCCRSCQTDLHLDHGISTSHIATTGEKPHPPTGATEPQAMEYNKEPQLPTTKIHAASKCSSPDDQEQQKVEAVGHKQLTTAKGWTEESHYGHSQGYYNEAGNWISTPQGCYEETSNWAATPATADYSASVEQSPQIAESLYPHGHYIQGFYDENNNWVQGYYDETGNWVWVPTVQQTL